MATDKAFEQALAWVLKIEGGYVNDPYDTGGATNKGIIQRTYDGYRTTKGQATRDVRDITGEEVRDIYLKRFWARGACHEMPDVLAIAHFDACVNHGTKQAGKLLQRTLGGLTVDGAVGPRTLAAILAEPDIVQTVRDYVQTRRAFYDAIVQRDSWQKRFHRGWMNRLTWLLEVLGITPIIEEDV